MPDKGHSHVVWCYNKHIKGKQYEVDWGETRTKKSLPHPAMLTNASITLDQATKVQNGFAIELFLRYTRD